MSLGIIFKGPEGIVLAVDSRVTLTMQIRDAQGHNALLPATYDNATKLLHVENQKFIGVVTYGTGAIGEQNPRTAHSFLPEFEKRIKDSLEKPDQRLDVLSFSKKLSEFFMEQWQSSMPSKYSGPDMVFLIGGFDDEESLFGRVFEVDIPRNPVPREWNENQFGTTWGGQREFVDRLIQGFDPRLQDIIGQVLQPSPEKQVELAKALEQLSAQIPYPFLPLQDCVDLSIFLIRTTITIQRWQIGIRGVGGFIDVATITRSDGFKPVQQKSIVGENC